MSFEIKIVFTFHNLFVSEVQQINCIIFSIPVMTRTREWADIVACHQGISTVTTWSYHAGRMGEHKLRHERFKTDASLRKAAATVSLKVPFHEE